MRQAYSKGEKVPEAEWPSKPVGPVIYHVYLPSLTDGCEQTKTKTNCSGRWDFLGFRLALTE